MSGIGSNTPHSIAWIRFIKTNTPSPSSDEGALRGTTLLAWVGRYSHAPGPRALTLEFEAAAGLPTATLLSNGPREIRTLDLLNAIETRSQLRYGPLLVILRRYCTLLQRIRQRGGF